MKNILLPLLFSTVLILLQTTETAAQFVGIGTTAPLDKLHINGGNARIEYAGSIAGLRISTINSGQTIADKSWGLWGMNGYGGATRNSFEIWEYSDTDQNGTYCGGPDVCDPRFVIASGGNVGLGTITPEAKLDVVGDVKVRGNDIFGDPGNFRINAGTGGYVELKPQSASYGVIVRENGSTDFGNIEVSANGLGLGYLTSGAHITIAQGGNVGVGTGTPANKLQVVGNVGMSAEYGMVINYDPGATYGYIPYATGIKSMAGIGPNSTYDFGTIIDSDALIALRETDGNKISGWFDLNSNKFVWNGVISSSRVKVQTNVWADYVFKEDYKLKSLKEVRSFIDKNGHLPNVPSEKEVLENGIDVSDMNVKLLEKIEELYLHTIQLSEDVEMLKQKNEELEQIIRKDK